MIDRPQEFNAAVAEFLAKSDETRSAFVEQLFHYMIKQPIRAYGKDMLPQLRESFAKNEFNIRRLAVDIVTTAAVGWDKPAEQATAHQE